jgi:hypothetical protein
MKSHLTHKLPKITSFQILSSVANPSSNLASFKKPKIQFSQCQDAQTPNKPVSKQPTFIMPTFKTTPNVKLPSFDVSRQYTETKTASI